jgi:hypothetical protein
MFGIQAIGIKTYLLQVVEIIGCVNSAVKLFE